MSNFGWQKHHNSWSSGWNYGDVSPHADSSGCNYPRTKVYPYPTLLNHPQQVYPNSSGWNYPHQQVQAPSFFSHPPHQHDPNSSFCIANSMYPSKQVGPNSSLCVANPPSYPPQQVNPYSRSLCVANHPQPQQVQPPSIFSYPPPQQVNPNSTLSFGNRCQPQQVQPPSICSYPPPPQQVNPNFTLSFGNPSQPQHVQPPSICSYPPPQQVQPPSICSYPPPQLVNPNSSSNRWTSAQQGSVGLESDTKPQDFCMCTPEIKMKYAQQIEDSEGFDVDPVHGNGECDIIRPMPLYDYLDDLSREALKWFKEQVDKKSHYEFSKIVKANWRGCGEDHYIIFQAKDASGSPKVFQARVFTSNPIKGSPVLIKVHFCRFKPENKSGNEKVEKREEVYGNYRLLLEGDGVYKVKVSGPKILEKELLHTIPNLRAWTLDNAEKYGKQVEESQGFDVDSFPGRRMCGIISPMPTLYDYLDDLAMEGLKWFKEHKDINLDYKFVKVLKANWAMAGKYRSYYITFEAKNASGVPRVFQVHAFRGMQKLDGSVPIEIKYCRFKPEEQSKRKRSREDFGNDDMLESRYTTKRKEDATSDGSV